MTRRALKRDDSEPAIVEALQAAGAHVERMHRPVDLLIRFRGQWFLLEAKTPGANLNRNDRAKQRAFCRDHSVPIVSTPEEALRAIVAMQ